jgi:hypothetical protein
MTETTSPALKRRALFPMQPAPQSVDETAIAAVAARNGFPMARVRETTSNPTAEPQARRRRQLTGRDHQFNVRLRRDTLDFIYAVANERNIPVAQVIEEATEALRAKAQG